MEVDQGTDAADAALRFGYDHRGGTSALQPTQLSAHLGVGPAPTTATSGRVSGEAWDARAPPSQASAPKAKW